MSRRKPPSAARSPFVQTGDMIAVDVEARQLNLRVADDELARRKSGWRQKPLAPRGYGRLFASHIRRPISAAISISSWAAEPLPEREIH